MTNFRKYEPNVLQDVLRSASQATDFSIPPVIIKAGPAGTPFYMDQQTLSQESNHFKAMLTDSESTASTRPDAPQTGSAQLDLPQTGVIAFNLYANWLRSRKIFAGLKEHETPEKNGVTARLILAYQLAIQIQDTDFHDAITDAMITHWDRLDERENRYWLPHQRFRYLLYHVTSPGSKARALLVHRMTTRKAARAVTDDDHPHFVSDLAKKRAEKDPEPVSAAAVRCKYHEHTPGDENCYRTKYARGVVLKEEDDGYWMEDVVKGEELEWSGVTVKEEDKAVTVKEEDKDWNGVTVKEEDKDWAGVTVKEEDKAVTVKEEDKDGAGVTVKEEDKDWTGVTVKEEDKDGAGVTVKEEDKDWTGVTIKEEKKDWAGVPVKEEDKAVTVKEEDKAVTVKEEDKDLAGVTVKEEDKDWNRVTVKEEDKE
ncbi:hypothetical protein CERZMDRAFT_92090 [Cercospora zeae-maydis SCOH1-5]|uniref:BTB domain-containing protein n=1 Tax=Cercospora zeae-maydis SCOH1-5 TaxID=717836 RepID=A0A6A6FVN3_9PEZI|nr:hypothetical protein CERZMDRAFT_92090 [Cercospora zeae-maydis SCOH1-5]